MASAATVAADATAPAAGATTTTSSTAGVVTVTGVIKPEDVGATLMHEHVIVDYAKNFAAPSKGTSRAGLGSLTEEQALELWETPMSAEVAGHCRCFFSANRDNMVLDSEGDAVKELKRYVELAGAGATIVECTIRGIGPNPDALHRVAKAAGVNMVAGTGYYLARVHPSTMDAMSVAELTKQFVRDITTGFEGSKEGVRAGIIGEVGCSTELQPNEVKVLQAAAAAQQATGAAISIHPGYDANAPAKVVDVLEAAGADLTRVVMGHVDRGLLKFEHMEALAKRGVVLEFDQFGWGCSYVHALAYSITYPSDFERCAMIKRLVDAGYGKQVVVAHDIAFKSRYTKFGGTGYDYFTRSSLAYLKKLGVSDAAVQDITVVTPRRLLTLPNQGRGVVVEAAATATAT